MERQSNSENRERAQAELARFRQDLVQQAGTKVKRVGKELLPVCNEFAMLSANEFTKYQEVAGDEIEPLRRRFEENCKTLGTRIPKQMEDAHSEAKLRLLKDCVEQVKAEARARKGNPAHETHTVVTATSVAETRLEREPLSSETAIEREDRYPLPESAAYQWRKLKVALSGDEHADIKDHLPTPSKFLVLAIAVILFAALEWLVSYDMFKSGSNMTQALGISLIFLIIFVATPHLTATTLRHYFAYRDARKMYAQTYPNGHPKGFQVHDFRASEKLVGVLALAVLLLASVGGFYMRVMPGGTLNTANLPAAIALLVLVFVYGLIEYSLTPSYSYADYEQLRLLEEESRRQYEEEQRLFDKHCQEIEAAGADRAMREEATMVEQRQIQEQNDPWKIYKAKRQEIFKWGEDEKAKAEAGQQSLVDLVRSYRVEWRDTYVAYKGACNELARKVNDGRDPFKQDRMLLRAARGSEKEVAYGEDGSALLLLDTMTRALLEASGRNLEAGGDWQSGVMDSGRHDAPRTPDEALLYFSEEEFHRFQGHQFEVAFPSLTEPERFEIEGEVIRLTNAPQVGGSESETPPPQPPQTPSGHDFMTESPGSPTRPM